MNRNVFERRIMDVRIPADKNFDFYACKKLYKKNQKLIGDDASFNQIIQNTFFFSFYDDKTLVGCIYVYQKDGKTFLNGFAKRGFHSFNIYAVKKIFNWFKSDIYAESKHKTAILLLLRCGFKKISENLFVYHNNMKGN